jgi:hypothetical protein
MKQFVLLILFILVFPFISIFSQTAEEVIAEADKFVAEFNNQKALDILLGSRKKISR